LEDQIVVEGEPHGGDTITKVEPGEDVVDVRFHRPLADRQMHVNLRVVSRRPTKASTSCPRVVSTSTARS
jgi:hypothetical protein